MNNTNVKNILTQEEIDYYILHSKSLIKKLNESEKTLKTRLWVFGIFVSSVAFIPVIISSFFYENSISESMRDTLLGLASIAFFCPEIIFWVLGSRITKYAKKKRALEALKLIQDEKILNIYLKLSNQHNDENLKDKYNTELSDFIKDIESNNISDTSIYFFKNQDKFIEQIKSEKSEIYKQLNFIEKERNA